MEYILNGKIHSTSKGGSSDIGDLLLEHDFDPGALRPYLGKKDRRFIEVTRNGRTRKVVTNAPSTLRKDEWIQLDRAVQRAARPELKMWGTLMRAGLRYDVPNAMGVTVLQSQTMTEISPATISMDGMRESERDRPEFDLVNLPLPIIHKDFSFSLREIATSRNAGRPIDTLVAEQAARRVAEEVEKLAIGLSGSYSYGGGTIYGLTNFPARNAKVLSNPETDGTWTPSKTVAEVLSMKQMSLDDGMRGPWTMFVSPKWDQYLDGDMYPGELSVRTLRERLATIRGITEIETLDYLTGYQVILMQRTNDVMRGVVGMDITTLQWPSGSGMKRNFKVMAILVPQVRADVNGTGSGIVHGTAP